MTQKLAGVILGGILLFLFSQTHGQSYAESALLFSRTTPGGSARIQGIGGAQISLGGDYSSALSNPAGLGMYNRSEFTISPGYKTSTTSASYFGTASDETRTSLNIPGLSLVINMPRDNQGFLGGSLAISMTRVNDFNNTLLYNGNPSTSIADYFVDRAFGYPTYEFYDEDGLFYNDPLGLAYHNYIIGPQTVNNPDAPSDEYFTDVPIDPYQQEEVETKGATRQWSISYGGNYNDKFFFGAGIGIVNLRYKSNKIFSESFNDVLINGLTLTENLDIRGSGINATLGLIARPVDFLQVGISLVTPTHYNITETYDASLSSDWNNFDYYEDGTVILGRESASTDIVTSDYNLTTPMKFSAGASFLSKFGFLSADVEFINPAKARYSADISGISYSEDNNTIKSSFQPAVNFRVGGEFRYEMFRVRAGYGVQGNSIRDDLDFSNQLRSISGGAGIKTKDFFVDLAIVHTRGDQQYSPYSFQVYDFPTPVAYIENKITSAILTVGFTF